MSNVVPIKDRGRKFTTSEAGRFLGRAYHSIVYAVGRGWLTPCEITQTGGMIFAEDDLRSYAKERSIQIVE
jgi:hypothetical protein